MAIGVGATEGLEDTQALIIELGVGGSAVSQTKHGVIVAMQEA